jgi:hypothetical protein
MCVYRNIEARSCNHCCSWKAISITYCVCVCSLKVSSMRCACAILSSVVCPALQYSSTLSHKRHDFRKKKKVPEHIMWVLIFSTTFVWNIFHSKKKWARYDFKKMHIGLRVKYSLFLSDFNETLTFSTVLEKSSNVKFHENPSSGSRVVPCGRTDWHDEANNRFSQFWERA